MKESIPFWFHQNSEEGSQTHPDGKLVVVAKNRNVQQAFSVPNLELSLLVRTLVYPSTLNRNISHPMHPPFFVSHYSQTISDSIFRHCLERKQVNV